MAKKTFNSPDSQEREYVRLLLHYSKQLQADVNRVLLPRIDDVIVQFKVESRADSWIDTLDSLLAELARLALDAMGSVVTRLPGQFNAVSKFNEGQFKLVVKANTGLTLPPVMPGAPSSSLLGVNVFRSEPFLKPLAEGWISENTSLIKSLPTRLHSELEGIVRRGVMNGQSVKNIKDQIKARYGVTDYRAKLIAQDQTLKLNADLTRYRLQSVGVERYIWRSVQDSRVRPEHADRNGNEYTWKEGAGGVHPGQEVRCRCRAEAVWDDKDEPEVRPAPSKKVDPIAEKEREQNFTSIPDMGLAKRKELFGKFSEKFEAQERGNPELARALRQYIYGGESGFVGIQRQLRAGQRSEVADILSKNMVPVEKLIQEMGVDNYVYRGLTSSASAGIKKGNEYIEKGLLSTSLNPIEAAEFATQRKTGDHILLRIKPGANEKAVVGAPGQMELIFPPNKKIRLIGERVVVEYNGQKLTLVDAVME